MKTIYSVFLITSFFTAVNVASAHDAQWQLNPLGYTGENDTGNKFAAVASSADGRKLVAVETSSAQSPPGNVQFEGYRTPSPIFVSADAGLTWTPTAAPTNSWTAVASSADGTKLVAAGYPERYDYWEEGWFFSEFWGDGLIYISGDSGATWGQAAAPTNWWSSLASSADATRLIAAADAPGATNGPIYISSDSGLSWTQSDAPTNGWWSVSSSADGTRLAALGKSGLYLSSDSGATWLKQSVSATNHGAFVANSADGNKLVLVVPDGRGIYISTNRGAAWTQTSATPASRAAWSADGTKLIMLAPGVLSVSTNTGATWTQTIAPTDTWLSLSSSADGSRLVAAGSGFYTWPYYGPWKVTGAPHLNWNSIATSEDGTKLVAAADTGIYASANSGDTWTKTSAPINHQDAGNPWTDHSALASSADGTKLLTAGSSGLYTSVDSGETWVQANAPTNFNWYVASSADGRVFVAVPIDYQNTTGSLIYVSTNSGATWSASELNATLGIESTSVASSPDGTSLVVGTSNGIYLSTNSGTTWKQTSFVLPGDEQVQFNIRFFGSSILTCSNDGTRIAAIVDFWQHNTIFDQVIFLSTDSGTTWTVNWGSDDLRHVVESALFDSFAASRSDEAKWIARTSNDIFFSTDSGVKWTSTDAPVASWIASAFSPDGTKVIAAASNGLIYTLQFPIPPPAPLPTPRLSINPADKNVGLSWVVPSIHFVLQQNADLETTNWTNVPASPALNSENLHYELSISPAVGHSYFRLELQ